MVFKSMLFGILGAVIAGLIVGIAGVIYGLSEGSVAAVASPAGIALGLLGFTLPLARPALERARATARTRRRR